MSPIEWGVVLKVLVVVVISAGLFVMVETSTRPFDQ